MIDKNKLDKALSFLRGLQIDKAMILFFELLNDNPKDIELIERIYNLAKKKPKSKNYNQICLHLFKLKSNIPPLHQLIINAFAEFNQHIDHGFTFDRDTLFNLFEHLGDSHLIEERNKLRQIIKQNFAEDIEISEYLKRDCEQLIKQKKIIQARDELKYLIAYYAETDAGRWALQQKSQIEHLINSR